MSGRVESPTRAGEFLQSVMMTLSSGARALSLSLSPFLRGVPQSWDKDFQSLNKAATLTTSCSLRAVRDLASPAVGAGWSVVFYTRGRDGLREVGELGGLAAGDGFRLANSRTLLQFTRVRPDGWQVPQLYTHLFKPVGPGGT